MAPRIASGGERKRKQRLDFRLDGSKRGPAPLSNARAATVLPFDWTAVAGAPGKSS